MRQKRLNFQKFQPKLSNETSNRNFKEKRNKKKFIYRRQLKLAWEIVYFGAKQQQQHTHNT